MAPYCAATLAPLCVVFAVIMIVISTRCDLHCSEKTPGAVEDGQDSVEAFVYKCNGSPFDF